MTSASIEIPTSAPPENAIEPAAAVPMTALDRIKAKLAEDKAKDARSVSFRLPIPQRPYLVVEYGPVMQAAWNKLQAHALEAKWSDVDMQARALILFARGVYLKLDDGTTVSADLAAPERGAPIFEERLARSLGIPWSAVPYEFVKTLYVLDGEVTSTALALLQLSGFGKQQEVAESAEGN